MSRKIRASIIPTNGVIGLAQTTAPCGYTLETIGSPLKNVPNNSTNPGTSYTGSHQHAASSTHTHAAVSISHKHSACTATAGSILENTAVNTGTPTISTGLHKHAIYTDDTAATLGESTNDGAHQHDATIVDTSWYAYPHIRKSSGHSIRQHNNVPYNGIIYTTTTPPLGYTLDTTGNGKIVNDCTYNTTGGTTNHIHGAAGTHQHTACLPTHLHAFSGSTDTGNSGENTNTEQGTVARTPSHTHTLSGNSSATGSSVAATLTAIADHSETTQTHEPAHVILGAARRTSIGIRQLGIPASGIIVWRCTLASIPGGFALTDGTGTIPNYLDKFIKIAANTGEIATVAGSHTHQHAAQSHTHTHSGGEHSHLAALTTGTQNTVTSPGVCAGSNLNNISLAHTHNVTSTNTAIFNGACNTAGYSGTSQAVSHQHNPATAYPKSVEVAFIQKT